MSHRTFDTSRRVSLVLALATTFVTCSLLSGCASAVGGAYTKPVDPAPDMPQSKDACKDSKSSSDCTSTK
jgi:hypothetical protein